MRLDPQTRIEDILPGKAVRPHILTCIPTFGTVSIEFVTAFGRLQFPVNGICPSMIIKGQEIGMARNSFVQKVLEMEPRPEFLFMFGDDMLPKWDAAVTLFEEISKGEFDCLAALYYWKGNPPVPLTWREDRVGRPIPGVHYQIGEVIECDTVGMDFTFIRVSALEKMTYPYFQTGPGQSEMNQAQKDLNWLGWGDVANSKGVTLYTEDVFFCRKFRAAGGRVGCHTGVRVGHLDIKNGIVY